MKNLSNCVVVLSLLLAAALSAATKQPNTDNVRAYSNAEYSAEGGDWVGCDVELTSGNPASGYVVFYESFWLEPTFEKFEMKELRILGSVATFKLADAGYKGEYRLQMRGKVAELQRIDVQETSSLNLKRQAEVTRLRRRVKHLTSGEQ